MLQHVKLSNSNLPLPHNTSDCLFSIENESSMKFEVLENLAPSPLNLISISLSPGKDSGWFLICMLHMEMKLLFTFSTQHW